MTENSPVRIDRAALERIIQRAAELQTAERDIGDNLTSDEVMALGAEVGIPGTLSPAGVARGAHPAGDRQPLRADRALDGPGGGEPRSGWCGASRTPSSSTSYAGSSRTSSSSCSGISRAGSRGSRWAGFRRRSAAPPRRPGEPSDR